MATTSGGAASARNDPARTESTSAEADPADESLWSPERRNFTIGMVLIITLVAFEAMGLATALPTVVEALGGERWYSWAFTLFMTSSAVGTVLSGRVSDRRGPTGPLLLGLPLFALGLLVAGLARNMAMLLAARALQGLAGGLLIVALYVVIARVYPQRLRPKAFGALSAAWVLPALVGPAVAGLLTTYVSWRWVFLGLAPLVLPAAVLLTATTRGLGSAPGTAPPLRRGLPMAALGASAGVIALNLAAQGLSAENAAARWPLPAVLAVAVAAAVTAVPCMRILLPRGTFSATPGIPVMVLARGLLAGVFFAGQAFVPLVLTVVHGYTPALAGIPLTLGSLGWSAGAWLQSSRGTRSRESFVATGFVLVAVAVGGLAAVAPAWGAHWLVFVLWSFGGAGMGMAIASTSVRVLGLSPESERGFNSSALQISDMLGQAVLIGLGGVLVNSLAAASEPVRGVVVLAVLLALVASAGAYLVARSAGTTLEER